jgi:hypothetical protein
MKKIIIALAIFIANFTIEAQVKTPAPSPKATIMQTVGLILHWKTTYLFLHNSKMLLMP